jgi:DNA replication protein DnaC
MCAKQMNELDKKELEQLQKIREDCPICHTLGYTEKKEDGKITLVDCSCVQRIGQEVRMIDAHIPVQYRHWTLHQLDKKIIRDNEKSVEKIKKYIEKIDKNIRKGMGLWFHAPPGLAKSSLICHILRKAMSKGFNPYWAKASHFVTLKFQAARNDPEAKDLLRHIFTSINILAIEELDKVYLTTKPDSFGRELFYELLSDLYDAKIALLVSSNILRDDCEARFPTFIQDRFRYLGDIPLFGESGRKNNAKSKL